MDFILNRKNNWRKWGQLDHLWNVLSHQCHTALYVAICRPWVINWLQQQSVRSRRANRRPYGRCCSCRISYMRRFETLCCVAANMKRLNALCRFGIVSKLFIIIIILLKDNVMPASHVAEYQSWAQRLFAQRMLQAVYTSQTSNAVYTHSYREYIEGTRQCTHTMKHSTWFHRRCHTLFWLRRCKSGQVLESRGGIIYQQHTSNSVYGLK